MGGVRLPLFERAMDEFAPIEAALRPSIDVDDATWGVIRDALSDALLVGARLGAEAVVVHAQEFGVDLDVELDLRPPR